jgi:hypothetical protein
MRRTNFFLILVVLLLAGSLRAAEQVKSVKIEGIVGGDPYKFNGEAVLVEGIVMQYGETNSKYTRHYVLRGDYGGIIKVIAETNLPEVNERYEVKGVVMIDNNGEVCIIEKLRTKLSDVKPVEFEEISPPEKAQKLKINGISYIKKKDFKHANKELKQALAITPNDQEIIILLEGLVLLDGSKISYRDYSRYKTQNPGSLLLEDLKKKLYDTYPGLPPEKYLEKAVNMNENTKGYYELEFKNTHAMIYIPGMELLVDKYEVANSQYLKFAAEKGYTVEVLKFSTLENYPNGYGNYPAIVSYEQAEEYCNAKGMRLPTEKEWERIAGIEKGDYPWGDAEADQAKVNRANFESMDDGYIDLAPVDSYAEFASPFGVVNMGGNVPEWVKTKINKGGGFLSEKEELKITAHSGDTAYVGFRCVMEVKK